MKNTTDEILVKMAELLNMSEYPLPISSDFSREQNKLYVGAAMGHLEYMLKAIEEGATISADEDLALKIAAEQGHLHIVKFLCENGANPASRDYAAIKGAEKNGHTAVVKFLYEVTPYGKNPSEQTYEEKPVEVKQRKEENPEAEFPEELYIAGLKKFLIKRFGKKMLYKIAMEHHIPLGFHQDPDDPNMLVHDDSGWRFIKKEGGYDVFDDEFAFIGHIESLDEIAF